MVTKRENPVIFKGGAPPGCRISKILSVGSFVPIQLHIFCARILKDWDVGIGALPQLEKGLVGILTFNPVAGENFGPAPFKIRQSSDRFVDCQAARFDDLLELRCSFLPNRSSQSQFSR